MIEFFWGVEVERRLKLRRGVGGHGEGREGLAITSNVGSTREHVPDASVA